MNAEEFEQLVQEGVAEIPTKFRRLLDNVVITVENEPTREQTERLQIREDETLFGLYEGVPKSDRGEHYHGVLPDRITIFCDPILEAAASSDEVRDIVRDTVWHEIAHHFGLDERRVRNAERKRTRRRKRDTS